MFWKENRIFLHVMLISFPYNFFACLFWCVPWLCSLFRRGFQAGIISARRISDGCAKGTSSWFFHCGAFPKSHFYAILDAELQIIEKLFCQGLECVALSLVDLFLSHFFLIILNLLIFWNVLMHFLVVWCLIYPDDSSSFILSSLTHFVNRW